MTTSTSDLEIAQQQYSLHRLYQASELIKNDIFVILVFYNFPFFLWQEQMVPNMDLVITQQTVPRIRQREWLIHKVLATSLLSLDGHDVEPSQNT